MPAKFVLKKGSSGKFRFNLLATNGQVIATSETYESKAAAMRGIASVQKNAPGAAVDDQTSSAKKTGAGKATAEKTAAKKTTARKATAKKTAAKQASARSSSTRKASAGARGSSDGDGNGQGPTQGGGDHQYDTVELQLGTCHYGGLDEEATLMATREDGTGWIAVCDEHRQQAERDGFVVNEDA